MTDEGKVCFRRLLGPIFNVYGNTLGTQGWLRVLILKTFLRCRCACWISNGGPLDVYLEL